jgi:hypothetical protein
MSVLSPWLKTSAQASTSTPVREFLALLAYHRDFTRRWCRHFSLWLYGMKDHRNPIRSGLCTEVGYPLFFSAQDSNQFLNHVWLCSNVQGCTKRKTLEFVDRPVNEHGCCFLAHYHGRFKRYVIINSLTSCFASRLHCQLMDLDLNDSMDEFSFFNSKSWLSLLTRRAPIYYDFRADYWTKASGNEIVLLQYWESVQFLDSRLKFQDLA